MYFKQSFKKEERKRIEAEKRQILEEMSVTNPGSARYMVLVDTYKELDSMTPKKQQTITVKDVIDLGLKAAGIAASVAVPVLLVRSEHKFETGGYTLSSGTARNTINEVYALPRNLNK